MPACAEEVAAAAAENEALRARCARSEALRAQHAQLLARLGDARGAAAAAEAQRDAAREDAAAQQQRVRALAMPFVFSVSQPGMHAYRVYL